MSGQFVGLTIAAVMQSLAPAATPDPVGAAPLAVAPAAAVQAAAIPREEAGKDISSTTVASAELAQLKGGQSIPEAVSLQTLSSNVSGNSIITGGSVYSGNIALSGGALSGFSGIGNFVFNTGLNNSLQGSVSVTVVLKP